MEKAASRVDASCQSDLLVIETIMASVSCRTDAAVSFFMGESLDECVTVGSQTEFNVDPHVDCQLICDGSTLVESGFKAFDVQMIASMRGCQDLVDSLLDFDSPLPAGLVTACVPSPPKSEMRSDCYAFLDTIESQMRHERFIVNDF